jgi:hypothetical protein
MPDEVSTEVEEVQGETPAQTKTLTQAEVDKIVKDRIAREKVKLDNLKAEFEAYKKDKEEESTYLNELVDKDLELAKKDLPAPVKALLDKLSRKEQAEWLSNPENAVGKKEIPQSPQGKKGEGIPQFYPVEKVI